MPSTCSDHIYEVRFGCTASGVLGVVGAVAVAVVTMVGEAVPMRWLIFACAVCVAGIFLAIMLSRQVALRVDSEGITLGGRAFWRYRATTVTVPWPEIIGVVVYSQYLPYGARLSYLGIQRHPRDTGPHGRLQAAAVRILGLGGGLDAVAVSRPIIGWRLDHDRLAAAVRHHAPHVAVTL
ncbi:hypothetical protein [Nocardia wallacei]|uniref:hypothetical protein n=1 Tax=Nocardia wallacei TaxID=480035 RepID=UPI002455ECAB|nr:hypothetical protein [Nocardia wallacei]